MPGDVRLIPARAGNTWVFSSLSVWAAAHPRSRGEHGYPLGIVHLMRGSSPLARGTHDLQSFGDRAGRLIPARAGNTSSTSKTASPRSAHPRSRGEHLFSSGCTRILLGSSPLARGTQQATRLREGWGRLIPARAGNTCPSLIPPRLSAAHPRSRGEHEQREQREGALPGSSPLARGTPCRHAFHRRGERLIPARAGNTL